MARLVAQYQRLSDSLHGMPAGEQRRLPDSLAVVAEGERFSPPERWRRGPTKASGLNMVKALDRVSQIIGTGFGQQGLEPVVPARRLTEGGPIPAIVASSSRRRGDHHRLHTAYCSRKPDPRS